MTTKSKIIVTLIVVILIVAGGTYYLKKSKLENKISPAQTAEIKDWQTYQNEKEGYSIQYPKHWDISQDSTQFGSGIGFSAIEVIKMPDDYRGVSIVVTDITLEDLIKKYEYINPSYLKENPGYVDASGKGPSQITEQKEFILGGVSGTKLTANTDDGSGQNFIFARKGDKSYIIFFHDYYETNLEMISTFRFLK